MATGTVSVLLGQLKELCHWCVPCIDWSFSRPPPPSARRLCRALVNREEKLVDRDLHVETGESAMTDALDEVNLRGTSSSASVACYHPRSRASREASTGTRISYRQASDVLSGGARGDATGPSSPRRRGVAARSRTTRPRSRARRLRQRSPPADPVCLRGSRRPSPPSTQGPLRQSGRPWACR